MIRPGVRNGAASWVLLLFSLAFSVCSVAAPSARAAEILDLYERCAADDASRTCAALALIHQQCTDRNYWRSGDCEALREVSAIQKKRIAIRFAESTKRLRERCDSANDPEACDAVLCLPAFLPEAPWKDVLACSRARALASGASWAQYDSNMTAALYEGTVLCNQIVESPDEIGTVAPGRPNILVRSRVVNGKLAAPFTVGIGGEASKHPRDEYPSLDAAATAGCREAARRLKSGVL